MAVSRVIMEFYSTHPYETRSQAVARIADRTSSQHFRGHVTSSVTWPYDSP